MTSTIVNPASISDWDAKIQAHSEYCFFHSQAWARVLTDTYGYRPLYHLTEHDGTPVSVFPLMEVDTWLTGKRGVGLPFTDHCWPLCSNGEDAAFLFESMKEFGRGRGWRYLEIKGGQSPIEGAQPALQFYNHVIRLSEDVDVLQSGLSSATRRAVRKAAKNGLTVGISRSLEALQIFYNLHCQARKRHGLPPQPYALFESMQRHVMEKDQGMVVLARTPERRAVAGAVFFYLGRRVIFKFGGSNLAYQSMRGNNLVLWEAMKWFAKKGFESLDFGKTSLTHEGLRQFKSGFGTEERLIEYYQYDLMRDPFRSYRDLPVAWVTRAFQLLPLPVLRMVGRACYRHMA